MRLYIRTDGSYAGTQADAGKGFTQVEVPTDKTGLIDYLNALTDAVAHKARVYGHTQDLAPVPPQPSSPSASALEDYILNTATVAEVERIFAALGTRFAELVGRAA